MTPDLYSLSAESFDHLLWYFHKYGYDPGPDFDYYLLRDEMTSHRWESLQECISFLRNFLVEVKKP